MKLFMVELPVANWNMLRQWLSQCLGLCESLVDDARRFALFEAGPCRLAIRQRQGPEVSSAGWLLHLEVDDLDAELARLAEQGVHRAGPIQASSEGYRQAVVLSPEGHRFSLFAWSRGATGPQRQPGNAV